MIDDCHSIEASSAGQNPSIWIVQPHAGAQCGFCDLCAA